MSSALLNWRTRPETTGVPGARLLVLLRVRASGARGARASCVERLWRILRAWLGCLSLASCGPKVYPAYWWHIWAQLLSAFSLKEGARAQDPRWPSISAPWSPGSLTPTADSATAACLTCWIHLPPSIQAMPVLSHGFWLLLLSWDFLYPKAWPRSQPGSRVASGPKHFSPSSSFVCMFLPENLPGANF